MKCPKGAPKQRHSKGHGNPNNYARSLRGHTWHKTPTGTVCQKCGKKQ